MMIYKPQVYDAWLASGELPSEWLITLLHEMKNSGNAYEAFAAGNESVRNLIPKNRRDALASAAGKQEMNTFCSLMEKHCIRSVTILDAEYPHNLRGIDDPPGILFYQGELNCLKKERRAAMVGSRSASYAGLKAARKIAKELSAAGVVIVSGLANGIDAECHRGCLEGGSPTIAVMGCGLDQVYPSENAGLKKNILEKGGLVISEYAPGSKPFGRHFPYRNRIISGLSGLVILMEAKIRSGSMTTIAHALKQGLEVYAYPGDPTSPMTEANRTLLREGARYFTAAEDILDDMNWLDNTQRVRQHIDCSAQNAEGNTDEYAVLCALERGYLGFDELMQATGKSAQELMGILTILQIKRKIETLPGKRYGIIR